MDGVLLSRRAIEFLDLRHLSPALVRGFFLQASVLASEPTAATAVRSFRTVSGSRMRISIGIDTVGGRPSCRKYRMCSCCCSCRSNHRRLPPPRRLRRQQLLYPTDNTFRGNLRLDDPDNLADPLSDARPAGNGTSRDRMGRSNTACRAVTASAVEAAGSHAASVKSSGPAASAATPGKGVVRDQACTRDQQCCQCSQRRTKHGTSSC